MAPEKAGFFGRLFGKKEGARGHATVACAGEARADGAVTGCHAPAAGKKSLLVVDLAGKPVDDLCGRCHADQRKPGTHHASYKADRNSDGVAETLVRPAPSQEVFKRFAPAGKRYPDALSYAKRDDGTQVLEVSVPLETVAEVVDGKEVLEPNVMTCTSCHNPHYGYLVVPGSEQVLDPEKVARKKGDALLRLRDYTNDLCNACH